MRTVRVLSSGLFAACLCNAAVVRANVEIPPAYDARSVGMGSSGVAHVHNGASLAYNPAAMQGIENGAVTLTLSPFLPQLGAPLTGPDTSLKSSRSLFPTFLVGGAYRINEKLTVGAAVFPTMGLGGKYDNIAGTGAKMDATLAAVEFAPGVSYALTDFLSVGATYRVTYMWFSLEQTDPATGVTPKVSLNGWNFLGVQLGLFAHATKTTRLGFTYRNKATASMSGKTEAMGQSMNTDLDFATPHSFKLGIAQTLLDDRLTLALDFKLSLYKEAVKELALKSAAGAAAIPLNWKNTVGVYAGGEYRAAPDAPAIRLGYSVSQSATPSAYALPILPPPALQHAIHLGAGMTFSKVDVDLGAYYLFSSGRGDTNPLVNGAYPGDYSLNAILIALGGTYRM